MFVDRRPTHEQRFVKAGSPARLCRSNEKATSTVAISRSVLGESGRSVSNGRAEYGPFHIEEAAHYILGFDSLSDYDKATGTYDVTVFHRPRASEDADQALPKASAE